MLAHLAFLLYICTIMNKYIITKQEVLHTDTVNNTVTKLHIYADEVEVVNDGIGYMEVTEENLTLARMIDDTFKVGKLILLPPKAFIFKLNGEVVETVDTFYDPSFEVLEMDMSETRGKYIFSYNKPKQL